MTNSIIKKYNFYDFNLNFESSCFKKNELSISNIYNIDISENSIKPLETFKNLLKQNFSSENYNKILEKNTNLIYSFNIIYPYSFLNDKEICNRIFALDSNHNLYELDLASFIFEKLNITFSYSPEIFIYNSKIFFLSYEDKLVYFENNSNPIYVTDFCNVDSFINYSNHLFLIEKKNKYKIFYFNENEIENLGSNTDIFESFELNPNNGEILDIKIFNNSIYLIQSFAISKVSFSNGKCSLSSIFPIASKILKKSIQQLDDYIVFLTSSGLFMFDGSNLKSTFKNIFNLLCLDDFISASYNEKYYLSCNIILEQVLKPVLIEFNFDSGKQNIFDYGNILNLFVIKNLNEYRLCIVSNKDGFKTLELTKDKNNNIPKLLKFNKLFFDDYFSKFLSELIIFSTGKYKIKIITEYEEKIIDVNGNLKLRNLGISGTYFQLEILSESYFNIESINLTIKYFSEKLWLIIFPI